MAYLPTPEPPVSYWQKGFNDGYAKKPRQLPYPYADIYSFQNKGYINGWMEGRIKHVKENHGQET